MVNIAIINQGRVSFLTLLSVMLHNLLVILNLYTYKKNKNIVYFLATYVILI